MVIMRRIKEDEDLTVQIEDLRLSREEVLDLVRAIRSGRVDALVVSTTQGNQVYTLKGAERPYRLALETLNEGVMTLTPDGDILHSNSRFAEIVRTLLEKVIGSSIFDYVSPQDRSVFDYLLDKGKQEKGRGEISLITQDGTPVPVQLSVNPLEIGEISAVSMVVVDLTEQKRAEKALREASDTLEARVKERTAELSEINERLQAEVAERAKAEEMLRHRTLKLQELTETLEQRVQERTAELANITSRLVSAQENERRQVSYDLHDNVWQSLEIIKSKIEHLASEDGKRARELIPLIRDTVARIRSVQGDLWPYVLDDVGILATLEWYCREFRASHPALGIERHVNLAEDAVPTSVKIVIYRVMQEALANVLKHSQATHVSLSLIKKNQHLEFTVQDDGIGFNPAETIARRSLWGGTGLLSMRQRTELSGGSFGVESEKGQGTTVRASWPL